MVKKGAVVPSYKTLKAEKSTYDMLTDSILAGVHLYSLVCHVAPWGSVESRVTFMVSPSGSDVVTINVLLCPTVALNAESTVMLGLPLAANMI